jgi:uncharacterized membrane protein
MQYSIEARRSRSAAPLYRERLAPLAIFLGTMAFLAVPLPLAEKAHGFMHGICAQRPSHTLTFGGGLLPFDARMTGIYTGFLAAFLALLAMRRHRRAGLPSKGAMLTIVLLAGAMATDGFNSLFTDLGFGTPYETDNRIRLFTGMGAGVGLAVMLCMLLGMSLWQRPSARDRVVGHWWEPVLLYLGAAAVALLLLTGHPLLLAPTTVVLVASAVTAFSGLALAALVLITRQENSFTRASELQPQIVLAVVLGTAAIGLLACGRFAVEAATNAPPLT